MKPQLIIPLLLLTALMAGCAGPAVVLSQGGSAVKVGKSDPADNYKEIGPITATDGEGCGGFGYRGTYDRAVTLLKNRAYQMGGDYVQIFTMQEPHSTYGCFVNTYTISGTLFKRTSDTPSPVLMMEKTEKSTATKLRELKALLDEGVISKEEFDGQKQRLLDAGL